MEDEILARDMLLVFARLNPLLLPVKSYKRPENLLGMDGKAVRSHLGIDAKSAESYLQLLGIDA